MNTYYHTHLIKQLSSQVGFDYCGIARAEKLDDDARRLEQWLDKGYHGKMGYMDRYFDMRTDPRLLVPEAKSVITFLLNYYSQETCQSDTPKISKYAYGIDYHFVIKEKLNHLLSTLQEKIGDIAGRGFVDSAPVMERSWAQRSGLGWVGKNANLINKNSGSYFFIATLIVDLELDYDNPYAKDFCGSCTRCIDSCPTDAIVAPAVVDATKCISYLTIELKDEIIPNEFTDKMKGWMFGCDICQDVCPWNRFAQPNTVAAFQPMAEVLNLSTSEWEAMEESTFNTLFKNSPLKRTKWKGIQRNLKVAKQGLLK